MGFCWTGNKADSYNIDQYVMLSALTQEEYSAAHQCFITENSLYVLCWRACDGEQGIYELKGWLLTIKVWVD